jgi:RNA polymerase sigma-70 factor, ECF subfamily
LQEEPDFEGLAVGDARIGEEFAELYDVAYGRVVAHAYAITADLGDAQELAQEAFLRTWQRWDQIRRYHDPAAWVIRVVHNLAVSRWRRARTAARGLLRMGGPETSPGPGPESVALVRALQQIPAAQRRALVMHHMADLSVAEIAAEEGVAVGTIKARLSRGRAALVPLLADSSIDDGRGPGPGLGRGIGAADEETTGRSGSGGLEPTLRACFARLGWAVMAGV